ncbi:MAG: GHKL domain-containing protein [Paramuribaculum sp.]|nr:GHKL domain-containing protein [Paramuribaculum sp.]
MKNAVEAIGLNKKGEITIDCFLEKNGYVRLDISNSGVAISDEIAKEIFSPFFTTKSQGQGIGLSLSKRIMVSQGGNLYMSHENHQRTTFSFTFLQA